MEKSCLRCCCIVLCTLCCVVLLCFVVSQFYTLCDIHVHILCVFSSACTFYIQVHDINIVHVHTHLNVVYGVVVS